MQLRFFFPHQVPEAGGNLPGMMLGILIFAELSFFRTLKTKMSAWWSSLLRRPGLSPSSQRGPAHWLASTNWTFPTSTVLPPPQHPAAILVFTPSIGKRRSRADMICKNNSNRWCRGFARWFIPLHYTKKRQFAKFVSDSIYGNLYNYFRLMELV